MASRKTKGKLGGRRPGAGRKPVLKDAMGFSLDLEGDQLQALEAIAAERGVSVASVIREAITAYLRRRGR